MKKITIIFLLFAFMITPSIQIWKFTKPARGQVKIVLLPFVSFKNNNGKPEIIYNEKNNTNEEYGISNQNDFRKGENFQEPNAFSSKNTDYEVKILPNKDNNFRKPIQPEINYKGRNQENFQRDNTASYERSSPRQESSKIENPNIGFTQPIINMGINKERYGINGNENNGGPPITYIMTEQNSFYNGPGPIRVPKESSRGYFQSNNGQTPGRERINSDQFPREIENNKPYIRNANERMKGLISRNPSQRGSVIILGNQNYNIKEQLPENYDGRLRERVPILEGESESHFQKTTEGEFGRETRNENFREFNNNNNNNNNRGTEIPEKNLREINHFNIRNGNIRSGPPPIIYSNKHVGEYDRNKAEFQNKEFVVTKKIQIKLPPNIVNRQTSINGGNPVTNFGNSENKQSFAKLEEESRIVNADKVDNSGTGITDYTERYIPTNSANNNGWKPVVYGVHYKGITDERKVKPYAIQKGYFPNKNIEQPRDYYLFDAKIISPNEKNGDEKLITEGYAPQGIIRSNNYGGTIESQSDNSEINKPTSGNFHTEQNKFVSVNEEEKNYDATSNTQSSGEFNESFQKGFSKPTQQSLEFSNNQGVITGSNNYNQAVNTNINNDKDKNINPVKTEGLIPVIIVHTYNEENADKQIN